MGQAIIWGPTEKAIAPVEDIDIVFTRAIEEGGGMMGLSTQDQILIEQRVTNDAKSAGVAYLLWFFTGGLGGHRFYLGRTGTALAMLFMTIIGLVTAAIGVGIVLLVAVGIWVLVDAFLIPGIIQGHKDEVRRRLSADALTYQRDR